MTACLRAIAALVVIATAFMSSSAFAQTSTGPAPRASMLTGKERLGEKWQDEQRIDNCKVPMAKRGTKPRSDSCAHIPSS